MIIVPHKQSMLSYLKLNAWHTSQEYEPKKIKHFELLKFMVSTGEKGQQKTKEE